jgi:hypothetical protein
MINLLPPEEKRQLRAAQSNVLLLRYNEALVFAVAFLVIALGVVYVFLNNTSTVAQKTITDNKAKVVDYAPIQAQASQFRANLATAKQILDGEVTYSKVILEIAKLMPSGTVLQNLGLDSSTFGTSTQLIALAKDYPTALSLKDSFQKSTLFSDVHFDSITSTTGGTDNTYPMVVTLDVTIKKGAAK